MQVIFFVYNLSKKNKLPRELRDLLTSTDLVDKEVLEHSVSLEICGETLMC